MLMGSFAIVWLECTLHEITLPQGTSTTRLYGFGVPVIPQPEPPGDTGLERGGTKRRVAVNSPML